MQPSESLQTIDCPNCSASIPILAANVVTCVYCAEETPVPPELAQPVQQWQELHQQMSSQLQQAEKAKSTSTNVNANIVAGIVVLFLPFISLFIRRIDSNGKIKSDPFEIGIIFGTTAPLALMLIGAAVFAHYKRLRHLARLPMVKITVHTALELQCPNCGATLQPEGEITVTCQHCKTEALLPKTSIKDSLQRLHANVMKLRKKLTRAIDEDEEMTNMNTFVGYALIIFGMFLGIGAGIVGWIKFIPPEEPPSIRLIWVGVFVLLFGVPWAAVGISKLRS